ncbi:MAG: CofH family radical SAM protein [bacterium]
MIPYANLAPVRSLGCPDGFDFIYLTPRQSVAALRQGRVVAAALPTGAWPAVQELVEPLGHYGVAASGAVGSVLLYSHKRLDQLGAADRVFLTGQSATSVLLLYLLLRDRTRTEQGQASAESKGQAEAAARADARPPLPAQMCELSGGSGIPSPAATLREATAVLLIGDEALVAAGKSAYPFCYDLASLWYQRFGKPMVFCRWVVRRDAPPAIKARLLAWLGELDTKDAALVEQSAANEAWRLGLPRQAMVTYLQGMRRVLTPEDLAGQEFFLEQAAKVLPQYQAWQGQVAVSASMFASGTAPDATTRLDQAESLRLLREAPLGELMARAHAERLRRHPGGLVPFVMDTNPNYTNICQTHCTFCAFHRAKGAQDAYTLTPDELATRVRQAADQGATTVLLQGGTHDGISLAHLVSYLRAIRVACPKIHLHPFSPSEIDAVAQQAQKPVEFVLQTLWDEGVHTIPGGGAEILSERVRQLVSPTKCSAARWLEIMESAHNLGFRTTATMMYGHVETDEEIVEHLFRLREVQDRTGGFSSFIPWSFKPGNSPLSRTVPQPAHPARYVRILALSRLVLDNFEHIQSSWFSESENAGSLGLLAGADDLGGILVEENVLKTTGHDRRTTVENVKALIRSSGFIPARRDSDYRIVEVFEQ